MEDNLVKSNTEDNDVYSKSLLESESKGTNSRIVFEEFTDERTLVSYDAFGNKQMKIKVLEVSDENKASNITRS
jgi:hypothetical protein